MAETYLLIMNCLPQWRNGIVAGIEKKDKKIKTNRYEKINEICCCISNDAVHL